jgi:CheY-like chemotaxis protein
MRGYYVAEKHILIVDDVEFNLDFESKLIHSFMVELKMQAVIKTAKNVEEAKKIIESEPPFDAIIIDMNLPDGTGVDVAKAAKEKSEKTRLAALTIYPSEYEKERPYFDLFMKKPIMLDSFHQNFLRLLKI